MFASLSLNVVDIDCLMPCSSNNDNDVNNGRGNMSCPCVVNELLPTSVEDNIFKHFAALPIDYRVVWFSGNALASINVVALRQTRPPKLRKH